MAEECVRSPHKVCPLWKYARTILNWSWTSHMSHRVQTWCSGMSTSIQAFNTYLFWGSRSQRPSEKHVKCVCFKTLTHTHWFSQGQVQRAKCVCLLWEEVVWGQQKIITELSPTSVTSQCSGHITEPAVRTNLIQSVFACPAEQNRAHVRQQVGECVDLKQSCSD